LENRELLDKVASIRKSEHFNLKTNKNNGISKEQKVKIALEIAKDTQGVLRHLNREFRKPDRGFIRTLKNKVIGKIGNIVRNVLDKPLISQQKYNQQVSFIIDYLFKENKNLKKRIKELESKYSQNEKES
jgi:hypothetical protein